jgi:hypothetical protein
MVFMNSSLHATESFTVVLDRSIPTGLFVIENTPKRLRKQRNTFVI